MLTKEKFNLDALAKIIREALEVVNKDEHEFLCSVIQGDQRTWGEYYEEELAGHT